MPSLMPEGDQVPYFVYFTVKPEDIDVNIHPTKTEIKFENEPTIWQILAAAVKDAVGMFKDVTAIEFDTEGLPEIPALGDGDDEVKAPKLQYNSSYNPFNEPSPRRQDAVPQQWEKLYDGLGGGSTHQPSLFSSAGGGVVKSKASAVPADGILQSRRFAQPEVPDEAPEDNVQDEAQESPIEEKSPVHYQYKGQYIMTAVKSGLMIIDQHRAHTRILYERYLAQTADRKAYSQKLLFPETVQFSTTEDTTMRAILPELEAIGFEIAQQQDGTYTINSVPAGLDGLNYVTLVQDLVATAADKPASATDDICHAVALELARSAAVTYGQVLTNAEMENIVNDLFACSNFNYTPDGKRVLTLLRQTEMERLLG